MRAWCPRCDAVRPGETVCPVCQTSLTTLDDTTPGDQPPGPPPPPDPAPGPAPAAPRLRIALAAATVVVAGLAFVAGRSIARPAAPAAAPAPATTTTAPEPGADRRQLGWTARAGGVTITAVEASRQATERRETVAELIFRVAGVPGDARVLGLRGLSLLDSGGGVFATVDQRQFGREGAALVVPVEGQQDTYRLVTGPAPRLSSLARIRLTAVVVVQARDKLIQLDTSGAWPAGPAMRVVDPGPADAAAIGMDSFLQGQRVQLELRVSSAFVRDGLALVSLDASSGFRGVPGEFLPIGGELRAGDRVLCSRTSLLGEEPGVVSVQGLVLSCPTRPVPRLTVAVGAGARMLPLEVTLRP
jgi:hypothetical protein